VVQSCALRCCIQTYRTCGVDLEARKQTVVVQTQHALPTSVAVYVANVLEEQILNGTRGPGTPLLQLELAAEFGVSRVPVRDALAVLEQRHLAVRVPRKGVIVRPISLQSVRDLFAARRLLETEIIRLAAPRMTPDDLDALDRIVKAQRAATKAKDLGALRAADREFHARIWQVCGNEVLEELVGTVWLRGLQARSLGHRLPDWGDKSIMRHERIVEALRRGDVAAATEAAVAAVDGAEAEIVLRLEQMEKKDA
jgi:DNA-binding GntR family transcriptional regulator